MNREDKGRSANAKSSETSDSLGIRMNVSMEAHLMQSGRESEHRQWFTKYYLHGFENP